MLVGVLYLRGEIDRLSARCDGLLP
jgi:hypothetical protein